MDTNERATLYVQYLEAAAKEYRCAVTDMAAKMAASRRLSFELYTARLIEGHNPDPATLRWFLEEEQRCMPPPEPLKVTVEIVHPSPQPDPPSSPPTPPDPPADEPTLAASNVIPLPHPNTLPRRDPGSIHNSRLPDGTPARMARSELWRYGAASDPAPDWGAVQSLPPIPPECFPK